MEKNCVSDRVCQKWFKNFVFTFRRQLVTYDDQIGILVENNPHYTTL